MRFVFTLMLLLSQVSHADISITDIKTWFNNEEYLADIRVDYQLPEQVLDALDNGVPLTFRLSLRVIERTRGWIFLRKTKTHHFTYRVSYRPLSTLYETEGPSHTGFERHNFVSRDALFSYLGNLQEISIIKMARLAPNKDYDLHVRLGLDIDSLPLPMKPSAYLSTAWRQQSEWVKWPLKR